MGDVLSDGHCRVLTVEKMYVIVVRHGPEAASTVDPADLRRLPPCSGNAAKSGFGGSWLILGSGIPLELDCTGRITPSGVLAHRASAPRAAPRSGCSRLHGLQLAHHRPQESNELARDGVDRDLWPLPIRQ